MIEHTRTCELTMDCCFCKLPVRGRGSRERDPDVRAPSEGEGSEGLWAEQARNACWLTIRRRLPLQPN